MAIQKEPAFPQINQWDTDQMRMGHTGMTLRDYFAAKAMQGLIVHYGIQDGGDETRCASVSYQFADAMLAERSK